MNQLSDQPDLLEQLADIEHQRWSGWQDYFFSKCTVNEDGSLIVPAGYVKALRRQIEAPYAELTEREKEYDREEARKSLAVVQAWIDEKLRHRNEHAASQAAGK